MTNFGFPSYHIRARDGASGGSKYCVGANGADVTIKVPVGTEVSEVIDRDEESNKIITAPITDLSEDGQTVLVAQGGGKGRGNRSYKTSGRTAPEFSSLGVEGEEKSLVLELKSIADVGLVGYPNAGKSSLLRAISKATPKVASYPFTTLKPSIGVVQTDESTLDSMRVADIPGLIEGAHQNVGLGHDFLRHIERVKVIMYVLDIAGSDGRDPVEDFQSLYQELRLYMPDLVQRKAIIFCNKMDKGASQCKSNILRLQKVTQLPIVCGSALKNNNLDDLIRETWFLVMIQDSQSRKQVMKLTRADKEEIWFGTDNYKPFGG
mmetsp:Transcript_40075/g.78792  ORF Transcript_40075/g.78792 Transcript_40075/m.78792 type:complete len:321 (+) Transcript_40075:192-1154(+)